MDLSIRFPDKVNHTNYIDANYMHNPLNFLHHKQKSLPSLYYNQDTALLFDLQVCTVPKKYSDQETDHSPKHIRPCSFELEEVQDQRNATGGPQPTNDLVRHYGIKT